MSMDRRKFIEKSVLASSSLLLPFYLTNCKKEDDFVSEISSGLEVDDVPYKELKYKLEEAVSTEMGVKFSGEPYLDNFFPVRNQVTGVEPGIHAMRHYDKLSKNSLISYWDPQLNYFPDIFFNDHGSKSTQEFKHLYNLGEALVQGGDVFVREADEYLPSWNWENIYDRPGSIYLGDWTINELNNYTSLMLEVGSVVLSFFSGGASAKAYALLNKIGDAQDLVIDGIDLLNSVPGIDIDKNRKHGIFMPDLGAGYIMMSAYGIADRLKNREENIEFFFPITPESWWKYKSGYQTSTHFVDGLEKIKGDDVVKIKGDQGQIEYIGFFNGGLRYFGFKDPTLGRVFYETPSVIGDTKLKVGKKFEREGGITVENYPQIGGTLRESFNYVDRENVEAFGKPYGGCFKVIQSVDINLINNENGQTVSEQGEMTHWFAKNIGKVKSSYGSQEISLFDYEIGGRDIKKSFSGFENNEGQFFGKKLSDKIKSVL